MRKLTPQIVPVADIGDWQADSAVGGYLLNRSTSGEYRDSPRAEDCDVSKTFAGMNVSMKYRNRKGRSLGKCVSGLWGHWQIQSISN